MTCEEAAEGVIAIVNANMTRLLSEVMLGRGYDPRGFSLLAYGGAGPLHACELARALAIGTVIIPVEPGTFSALGILKADIGHDHDEMLVGGAGSTDAGVASVLERLRDRVRLEIEQTGVATQTPNLVETVDVRYEGQDHTLVVDVRDTELGEGGLVARIGARFHQRHEQLYGFRRDDREPQIISARVSGTAALPRPPAAVAPAPVTSAEPRVRAVFAAGGWLEARVYERGELAAGHSLAGPLTIEERGSTTYVPPGCSLSVQHDGAIHIAVPIAQERLLDAV